MQKYWSFYRLAIAVALLCICFALPGPLARAMDSLPLPSGKPAALDIIDAGQVIPKPKPWGSDGTLSPIDAGLYKRIFRYQAVGDMRKADAEIAKLKDFRLRGHVLYQRYMHPTAYRSKYSELRNWLDLYADLPGADRVYKLALARMPKDNKEPLRKPVHARGNGVSADADIRRARVYRSPKKRNATQRSEISRLQNVIARDVRNNAPTRALGRLGKDPAAPLLDHVEEDLLRGQIAVGYYHAGKIEKAFDVAAPAAQRSGTKAPVAGWIAGLAAWRLDRYMSAADYFEMAGESSYSSGWMAAAASYWAARSHMRTGNAREVSVWLKRAAGHSRTFYGLVAARTLGDRMEFNWALPTYTQKYHDILMQHEEGQRAMALVAAEQVHLAEAELMRINTRGDQELRNALLSYAGYAGLPGLQMRLANTIAALDDQVYDAALYPVGPWQPRGGFKLQPELLNAVMRQESRFDQMAESRSGAMGLMQLMPKTAIYISGNKAKYKDEQAQLEFLEPEINLELGQRYLANLMKSSNVDGEVMSLLIAYNAGPGNLNKFKRELSDIDDPLLFIESIPLPETRAYIERVLANYWIYQMRGKQPTPTLEALAAGKPARYADMSADQPFAIAASR